MSRQRWQPVRRRILVPTPAAGAQWTQVANRGVAWYVAGVTWTFTTDANVATRAVGLRASTAGDIWFASSSAQTQLAGLTRLYSAFDSASATDTSASVNRVSWPSKNLWLAPGELLASDVSGMQVGDQHSAIVLLVWEFPGAPPLDFFPFPSFHDDAPGE